MLTRRSTIPTLVRGAAVALLSSGGSMLSAGAGAPVSDLAAYAYSDDQHAVQALDREIAAASREPAKLRALAAELLARLNEPASPAARQAICQRLGTLLVVDAAGNNAALEPLRDMLTSDRDVEFARLALEPVPGAAVDALFTSALRRSKDHVRIALLQSIAARRIAAAVPEVTPLLAHPDESTARAAAYALGAIGTPDALTALRHAPHPDTPAVVTSLLRIAPHLPPAEATALTRSLGENAQLSAPFRAAALRISLASDPAGATARITTVLSGNEWPLKEAALDAIATTDAPTLVPTLASKLSSWDAATQVAVISALGRRGDAAAEPALIAALSHADPEVRGASTFALGFLPGTPAVVNALANVACRGDGDQAKQARQSLARLGGADVDAVILDGVKHGAADLRPIMVELLAARAVDAAVPVLRELRHDRDVHVRSAAIAALGSLAPATEQPLLIGWAVDATDPTELSHALRALATVTQRASEPNRSQPIIPAIETAPPVTAVRVVPVLALLGDRASAECAGRLALHPDRILASTATAALARWSNAAALEPLVSVVEGTRSESDRRTASQAALRWLERRDQPWSADATRLATRLLRSTVDNTFRLRVVRLLGRARDDAALNQVESAAHDAALATAARYAAQCIRANRAGPPALRASMNAAMLRYVLDDNTATRWSARMDGPQWVEVDFKTSRPITRVTLDATGRGDEFPEQYEVYITDNPAKPGTALASGAGAPARTVIDLPAATKGRYLIIKNRAAHADRRWSICELQVD